MKSSVVNLEGVVHTLLRQIAGETPSLSGWNEEISYSKSIRDSFIFKRVNDQTCVDFQLTAYFYANFKEETLATSICGLLKMF